MNVKIICFTNFSLHCFTSKKIRNFPETGPTEKNLDKTHD